MRSIEGDVQKHRPVLVPSLQAFNRLGCNQVRGVPLYSCRLAVAIPTGVAGSNRGVVVNAATIETKKLIKTARTGKTSAIGHAKVPFSGHESLITRLMHPFRQKTFILWHATRTPDHARDTHARRQPAGHQRRSGGTTNRVHIESV